VKRTGHQVSGSTDPIAQAYVRLALSIGQHRPDYVDAYYGPRSWQDQARSAGPRPLTDLLRESEELTAAIAADTAMNPQRADFLTRQVRAMQISLRRLQGERPSLVEDTKILYDITPQWVDEASFAEAHRTLDESLPPGDSLAERLAARNEAAKIIIEPDSPVLNEIIAELRARTRARLPLPPDESFALELVRDRPWSAYNWYLGEFRSRIEINTDRPMTITRLVDLMAHEGYPGHHTELSSKEASLVRAQGWVEHSVTLLDTPSCVVAEGIATRALATLMSDDELVSWYATELFPRAGLKHLDASRERAIDAASLALEAVTTNAVFLLFEQHASDAEVSAYAQRHRLNSRQAADQLVRFLHHARSYAFTYHHGGTMLDALFASHPERDPWFARLLREPVTPSQIRSWSGYVDR